MPDPSSWLPAGKAGRFGRRAAVRDFGDGMTSNEVNPVHEFSEEGIYEVCMTVSNDNGSDTQCREVDLLTTLVKEIPGIFHEINIFPNPASEKIKLSLGKPLSRKGELRLYNAVGQLVKSYPMPAGYSDYRFPVETLPKMMYFYSVGRGNEIIASGKLVVY